MSKDAIQITVSPFRFGFYAGLGFFFASLLGGILSVLVMALIGLGTVFTAAATNAHSDDSQPVTKAKTPHARVTYNPE